MIEEILYFFHNCRGCTTKLRASYVFDYELGHSVLLFADSEYASNKCMNCGHEYTPWEIEVTEKAIDKLGEHLYKLTPIPPNYFLKREKLKKYIK